MSATLVETLPGPPGQPDIAYTPNPETYKIRIHRRQQSEELSKTLPQGFPQRLDSPLVWDGATVSGTYKWSYELNEAELEEIHQALEAFKSKLPSPKVHSHIETRHDII
jgi:hypothetical protein